MNQGYYFAPHIHSNKLVFSCDDDLWLIEGSNTLAVRLTDASGRASHPYFSPDGTTIAYQANDSGVSDIYLIETHGGEPRRLTHIGIDRLLGFRDSKTLLFVSSHLAANRGMGEVYTLDLYFIYIPPKLDLQIELHLGIVNKYYSVETAEMLLDGKDTKVEPQESFT